MFTTRALFSRIANGNDITLWEKKDDDGAPEREDTRRIAGDVYGSDGLSADVDSNDFEINDVLVEDKRIRNGEAKYLSRDFVKMWLETKISEGQFIWRPEHGDFGLPHPVIGDMPIGLSDAGRILGRAIRAPQAPNRQNRVVPLPMNPARRQRVGAGLRVIDIAIPADGRYGRDQFGEDLRPLGPRRVFRERGQPPPRALGADARRRQALDLEFNELRRENRENGNPRRVRQERA